jgi:hypothetical protein
MSAACRTCPHVGYMNNECAHPVMHFRKLDWPGKETSHFPAETPTWCPLQTRKKRPPSASSAARKSNPGTGR